MEIFEGEVVLSVSPEDAFAIIGDPANASRIDPMIRSYEPEGGTMREGGLNHIWHEGQRGLFPAFLPGEVFLFPTVALVAAGGDGFFGAPSVFAAGFG